MAADRDIGGQGESLVRITLPPETPEEARIAVRRLVELTTILARRCDQLQEALDSRIVIEQAKGVLSARLDLSVDQSFDLLRRAARTHRLSLRDLAAEVVESDTVPPKIACMLFGAEVGHSRDPGATRKVSRAG